MVWLKVVAIMGILSLIHCAYSAAQYRAYLRSQSHSSSTSVAQMSHLPPIDTILQTLISFIITLYCVTQIGASNFKEIRATAQFESKSLDFISTRPSFYLFSHRGQTWFRHIWTYRNSRIHHIDSRLHICKLRANSYTLMLLIPLFSFYRVWTKVLISFYDYSPVSNRTIFGDNLSSMKQLKFESPSKYLFCYWKSISL